MYSRLREEDGSLPSPAEEDPAYLCCRLRTCLQYVNNEKRHVLNCDAVRFSKRPGDFDEVSKSRRVAEFPGLVNKKKSFK